MGDAAIRLLGLSNDIVKSGSRRLGYRMVEMTHHER